MSDATRLPPAGWYHDGTALRWWDGAAWGPAAPPVPGQASTAVDPVREGTTMAVLCHVGMFFAGIVLPLVLRLTEGKKNEYVRHHSTEALNFQLTFLIVWFVGIVTAMIGMFAIVGTDGSGDVSAWFFLPFLSLFAVYGLAAACAIVGAVRAGQGRWWRYPISIRFVDGARPKQPDGSH